MENKMVGIWERYDLKFTQLSDFFLCSHIAVPFISIDYSDAHETVRRYFVEYNFDVLGFKQNNEAIGYLHRDEYDYNSALPRDNLRTFQVQDLIAVNTPLITALHMMQSKERLFIMNRTEVKALITRADLEKPPVRMLFFGLVTLFESEMGHFIRSHHTGSSWRELVTKGRWQDINDLYETRKKRNVEIDLIDCTQFADKRTILISDESIREALFDSSKSHAERWLKRVESLRNDLAHAQSLTIWFEEREVMTLLAEMTDFIERMYRNK